ncbi:sugar phosphate nucleotidyltransferase [Sporosarcina thermotolerans]|uniref:sugar phosphate nucleotidyltransferase n=1 Tax=Sporosarcina thermotolerans TaxID=633404 RepID=UPI0024BC7A31|nr:sugar phosphate nucleotidyltransferase [Sporosarcina thermotolerans]WHT47938.1 sugar phosphate nucleotidyltransferase [Sporosarcina thermotolerans]
MTSAIILAAGQGTRLCPLTEKTHKSLLTINKEPFLERTIKFLIAEKVEEIIIVTGYLNQQFEYLAEKFKEVRLVFNDKYVELNNAYSLYIVRDFLADSYILEGDLFIKESVFKDISTDTSNYFVKRLDTTKEEWLVTTDLNSKIVDIRVGQVCGSDYISAGITYLNDADGHTLKNVFEGLDFVSLSPNLYWDTILKNNLENLNVYVKIIPENLVYEIDDLEDYKSLLEEFNE